MPFFKKNERGMTLIELLIVVAIIGILSAIAIVNYLVALDKTKQKKTMADIRSVANAWEARALDKGGYSAAGAAADDPNFSWPATQLTGATMFELLSPTYVRPLTTTDGWGRDLEFAVDATPQGSTVYAIRSAGKDGVFQTAYTEKIVSKFECDIVFSNGTFIATPGIK